MNGSPDRPEERLRRLEERLRRQQRLVDASYALHTTLDLDEVLGLILVVARDGVGADLGTVFLLTPDGKELWSRVKTSSEAIEIRLPLGRGLAGAVAVSGETVRIEDAYDDARFDRSWDEKTGYRTKAVLCLPVRNRDGSIVGVIQMLNKRGGAFTEEDEEFLDALSVHAALALENARLHASRIEKERYDREVGLALEVQRQLQPGRCEHRMGEIEAAGINEMYMDASGDYYDFVMPLPGQRMAVAIGDVSGHGLQAALVMAEARAFLRAFVRTATSLPDAMDLLNDALVPDLNGGRFLTLFAAVIDTAGGAVEWCNAGHNPPLLLRASDGTVGRLMPTGRVLGILPGTAYRHGARFVLAPGDTLLAYTDGVTEARGPGRSHFGEERLCATLAQAAGGTPAALLDRVRDAIRTHTGRSRNEDDLTMVAVRRSTGR